MFTSTFLMMQNILFKQVSRYTWQQQKTNQAAPKVRTSKNDEIHASKQMLEKLVKTQKFTVKVRKTKVTDKNYGKTCATP